MRFAVLSDTHYISKSTLHDGGAHSPRDLLRHEINRKVFDDLKQRTDIDTILITGDLTDAGDVGIKECIAAFVDPLVLAAVQLFAQSTEGIQLQLM